MLIGQSCRMYPTKYLPLPFFSKHARQIILGTFYFYSLCNCCPWNMAEFVEDDQEQMLKNF